MFNVTWRRFDQSAKQLIVDHTTIAHVWNINNDGFRALDRSLKYWIYSMTINSKYSMLQTFAQTYRRLVLKLQRPANPSSTTTRLPVWSSCHPETPQSFASSKSRLVLPAPVPSCLGKKRPLNGCSSSYLLTYLLDWFYLSGIGSPG